MRKAMPVLHVRLIIAALSILLFGIAHAGDSSAGRAADDVMTVQTTLAGVPAILRIPKVVRKRPIVLWHGFGPPAGESELMTALPLDDVPSVKVYLGLPLFGARAPSNDAESLARRQAEDYASRLFEPVVVGAAKELPAVLKALRERGHLGSHDEIGLFGFSAGGTAVLIALAERDAPVRAAITVNAPIGLTAAIDALERATKQPYAWTESARQLAQRSDSIQRAAEIASGVPPRALLLFHGADDSVVGPSGAVSLREALQPYYRRSPNDLQLVIAPGVSHNWTQPPALQQLRASVADWFNRYL
jgi:pimeloyl-ACP methyl ester carboxylesterase